MKKVKQMFNQIVQLLSEIREINELAISIKKTKTEFLTDMPLHDKIVKDMASQLQSTREENIRLTEALKVAKADYEILQDAERKMKTDLISALDRCFTVMMQPVEVEGNGLKLYTNVCSWIQARAEAENLYYSVNHKLKEIKETGPKAGEGGIKEVFVVDVPSEKLRESRLLKTIEELKEENSNYEKMLKVVKNDFDVLGSKYDHIYKLSEARMKDIIQWQNDFNVLENRYERLQKLKDQLVNAIRRCYEVMSRPVCITEYNQITSLEVNPFSKWDIYRNEAQNLYNSVMEQLEKEKEAGLKAREEVTKQREGPRPGETVQGWANRMRGNSDVVDNKTNY